MDYILTERNVICQCISTKLVILQLFIDIVQIMIKNKVMRHNEETKKKVIYLRKAGLTLIQIQEQTNLPKTTIYEWIRTVALTRKQLLTIKDNALKSLQKGRIIAQKNKKSRRLKLEKELLSQGVKSIGILNERERFITGVALYWAEGFKSKHEHRLGFCNSDPAMIRFYLTWLKSLGISKKNIIARATVNISYKEDIERIVKYWSTITGIPLKQFSKPFYQQTKWIKQYPNKNYYGVLRIHVNSSSEKLILMKGWIDGLKNNIAI